ncbi:hypothetical protein AB0D30_03885 [Streptomyces sp. NPDC048409]|uniref:hypothetical protein n=1 Tax=Streptomyces sp. NPDC048409 TaxID=3154723 RepID=UPI0034214550
MTGHGERAATDRAGRAGTCVRAGLFAVLGTVLAALGHHAIAEGAVPWRLVGAMAVLQFAAVWPLARRRCPPAATVLCTLAVQGALHLALSYVAGDAPTAMPGHAGHTVVDAGDGHAWHHAGAAMTTVHVVAALAVAWLLCRADARMTAALTTLTTVTRAAAAGLAQVLLRPVRVAGRPAVVPSGRWHGAAFETAAAPWNDVLEHAVVRRGPPRAGARPVRHPVPATTGPVRPVHARSSPCPRPCPSLRWPWPAAVSLSPALPR